MKLKRCAESPLNSEFSLCGDAFDIRAVDGSAEECDIAKPGESITCPECCRIIREVKALRNPLRPRKGHHD